MERARVWSLAFLSKNEEVTNRGWIWWDSNCRFLVLEATTVPLPRLVKLLLQHQQQQWILPNICFKKIKRSFLEASNLNSSQVFLKKSFWIIIFLHNHWDFVMGQPTWVQSYKRLPLQYLEYQRQRTPTSGEPPVVNIVGISCFAYVCLKTGSHTPPLMNFLFQRWLRSS